jgi:hypothetical protein
MKRGILHFARNVPVILLIIVIGILPQSQAFGQELSAVQKEIWEMEEKYWSSWKKGGARSIHAFHNKAAIIWASNATFTTTIKNVYGEFDGIGDLLGSFELEPDEIRIFGIVAVAQYYAKINSLGKPITLRISHTWMKQDGKWVIIGAMHGSCSNLPNCLD